MRRKSALYRSEEAKLKLQKRLKLKFNEDTENDNDESSHKDDIHKLISAKKQADLRYYILTLYLSFLLLLY